MADVHVQSDGEEDVSAIGKSSNCSVDSEDDSLLGFEDDLDEDDGELDIGEPATSNEATKSNGEVPAKRKRKQADPTKRKRIRRILREDELTEGTISAQKEERERLRRLELQRSLATAGSSSMPTSKVVENLRSDSPSSGNSKPSSPVAVDVREKRDGQPHIIVIDSDDEGDSSSSTVNYCDLHRPAEINGDLIEIISSDSEVEVDDSDNDDDDSGASLNARSDVDYDNSGLHTDDSFNRVDQEGRVLVNVNHPADEEDIFLAPQIARVIKAHQIGGIRFLYDNLVETLSRYKVSSGFGCILAHSMGLGKTLQVASFIDIFLRYTTAKKVLCIVPINTIQNWQAEFNMWLPPKPGLITDSNGTLVETSDSNTVRYRDFEVYLLGDNHKTTMARAKVIGEWNQRGGVLLMGYELYRLLSTATPSMSSSKSMPTKKKKSPTPTDKMNGEPEVIDLDEEEKHMELLIGVQKALCRPGADLVICDEGHRIKNDQANISQALKKIHTRRRVVLTGYPLQNNLQEYWCMVDFVRPNFLGTKQEFCNMFERPILNGQCSDSTPSDVRVMRYRAHVLHSLLEGFVQRRSQAVLKKCLPSKEEHIILVNMSPIQKELYNTFVERLLDSVGYINPIKGFHTCTKIWNHPDIFYRSLNMKNSERNESPLTILEDSNGPNGSSQNSRSLDGGGCPSNLVQTAGISQNQSSGSQLSPYSSSSSNPQTVNIQPSPVSSQLSNQTVVRSTMQLHQMVSYQLAGQTVAMSTMTTQTSQSTSNNVMQPVPTQSERSSPFVEDMTWAKNLFKDYQPGVMKNGGKLVVLMEIIEESLKLGEKILIFSQSLSTLSAIEEFLSKRDVPFFPGRVTDPLKPVRWAKNKSYFRLDGNTSAQERERLINRFNAPDNNDVLLFMLSTRAGCLGINLVGASRVVVFDASWNPCHDVQAVCRVYRYGQEKPVHIYRLISTGTMEKKIYDRQISKQGMANRIVDELNPEANFTKQEIMKLICEKEAASPAPDLVAAADKFSDPVLVRLCRHCIPWISKIPFKHDSLLVDKKELKLTRAEKREAKRGYEMEKRAAMQGNRYCPGVIQPVYNRNIQPYVPKPTYPVGVVSQQPRTSVTNCAHHQTSPHIPSPALNLPLASLLRAGVAVPSATQTTQSGSSRHNSTSSTSASASSSKDEVVMIDLDELPSPTKPMQEPVSLEANQTRLNNDLVRMARNAFPNISPQFVKLLINQGGAQVAQASNAQGSASPSAQGPQAPNASGSQTQNTHLPKAPSVRPQVSTQVVNIAGASSGEKEASVENTSSNSMSTAKNSQTSEKQPSRSPSSEEQPSPTRPLLLDVIMVSNEADNPAPQETADVSSSRTPPTVQDGATASNEPDDNQSTETAKVRSSPTPPIVNELRSSPSPQGEVAKDSTSNEDTS